MGSHMRSAMVCGPQCSSLEIPFGNVRTAIMSQDGSRSPKCEGSMQFGHVRTAMVFMDEDPEMGHRQSSQSSENQVANVANATHQRALWCNALGLIGQLIES